ncbi:MAG TPA: imelysin family protein [Planctomycetota bacterium]|nr:imelysin family protein [Planctomycetota bacterium]
MNRATRHRLERVLAALALSATAPGQTVDAFAALRQTVVHAHAVWCHSAYRECRDRAVQLREAIGALLAAPGAATLSGARAAWQRARAAYCVTEAMRFQEGPIEALEPLLNAWPIDEAYIDYVQGQPEAGIVHDRVRYPRIGETVLVLANERGGEANVSVGWHAIEFLLWGQDLRADGAGDRPFTDYQLGVGADADRRREYLSCIVDLLVRQLDELVAAWAPDAANHRRRFEADPEAAVGRMLTGVTVLTAFELGGERLAVAFETQDQEQEHSCFSDTTCEDLVADQLGIVRVIAPDGDAKRDPGLLSLVAAVDVVLARELQRKLLDTLARLRAIPAPFDQAMLGTDEAPGRRAMRAALDALDEQAECLSIAGRRLGYELPLRPNGR